MWIIVALFKKLRKMIQWNQLLLPKSFMSMLIVFICEMNRLLITLIWSESKNWKSNNVWLKHNTLAKVVICACRKAFIGGNSRSFLNGYCSNLGKELVPPPKISKVKGDNSPAFCGPGCTSVSQYYGWLVLSISFWGECYKIVPSSYAKWKGNNVWQRLTH